MKNFKKTVNLGKGVNGTIYVTIELTNNNLSISGVEGPTFNGNCLGSCGQIKDVVKNNLTELAPGFTQKDIDTLLGIWELYHLNNMQAGCEHQRALDWKFKPIDPSKPLNTYGKHFDGQKVSCANMLIWVSEKEHPQGLLGKPCPICGHKYGTKWLRIEVPAEVLQWLKDLPRCNPKIGTWFN